MTDMPDEAEQRRLHRKFREAAFSYFLWSLPIKTPPKDVVELAEELAATANKMMMAYYHSKGILDDEQ